MGLGWQKADPSQRLCAIGGPNAQDPRISFDEFPGTMEQEAAQFGWGHPGLEILEITHRTRQPVIVEGK